MGKKSRKNRPVAVDWEEKPIPAPETESTPPPEEQPTQQSEDAEVQSSLNLELGGPLRQFTDPL